MWEYLLRGMDLNLLKFIMTPIIVNLTYWQTQGFSKMSEDYCFTLLAQGGGYGICVIEVQDDTDPNE
jgi:hypothetical protein